MSVSIRHWDKTGVLETYSKDWGREIAGITTDYVKYFIENTSTRTLVNLKAEIAKVGVSDGNDMFLISADDGVTVVPPYTFIATLGSSGDGGVWAATGTYYYSIASTNALGETEKSTQEVTITVDVVTKRVTLTWSVPTGATGYKIYRSQTAGSYATPALVATISSGSINTYVDDGTATTTGAPAVENTTGGAAPNYGSPLALGQSPVVFGHVAPYQKVIYWVEWILPISATEDENPRRVSVKISET